MESDGNRSTRSVGPTLEYAGRVPKTNTDPLAMASIILGGLFPFLLILSLLSEDAPIFRAFLWFWPVSAGVAIACGVVGLRRTQGSGVVGRERARFGFWLGTVSLILFGIVVAMLVILFSKSHGRLYRATCASQLRSLGQAVLLYANDNRGKMPNGWDELMTTADLNPAIFVCPASGDQRATGTSSQAMLADFAKKGRCSYVYLGRGNTTRTMTADGILAYEPMRNHGGAGVNVLYGDGHVEWVTGEKAKWIIGELKAGHNPPRAVGTGN